MIKRLFVQIATSFSVEVAADSDIADREDALRLATAVLMVDIARADHVFDESEFDRVLQLIESHFRLTPEQSAELVNSAGSEAESVVRVAERAEQIRGMRFTYEPEVLRFFQARFEPV